MFHRPYFERDTAKEQTDLHGLAKDKFRAYGTSGLTGEPL
jgi:hypothetical protein